MLMRWFSFALLSSFISPLDPGHEGGVERFIASGLQPKSLKRRRYEAESVRDVTPERCDLPRVVISLALKETPVLHSEAYEKWFSSHLALNR